MDGVVYWLELVAGDVWTVWYIGWRCCVDGVVYWLELVAGDVWTVWYIDWR